MKPDSENISPNIQRSKIVQDDLPSLEKTPLEILEELVDPVSQELKDQARAEEYYLRRAGLWED